MDGVRLLPEARELSACFLLPADAREIWLCAPASVLAHIGDKPDTRSLGLCLSGLTPTAGLDSPHAVPLDDPALETSFHEPDHRWTAGRARLPASLLAGLSGPVFLRLDLGWPALPRWVGPQAEAAVAEPAGPGYHLRLVAVPNHQIQTSSGPADFAGPTSLPQPARLGRGGVFSIHTLMGADVLRAAK